MEKHENRRFWKRCESFQQRCFAAGRVVKKLPPHKIADRATMKMLEDLRMELGGLTGNYDLLAMMDQRK